MWATTVQGDPQGNEQPVRVVEEEGLAGPGRVKAGDTDTSEPAISMSSATTVSRIVLFTHSCREYVDEISVERPRPPCGPAVS